MPLPMMTNDAAANARADFEAKIKADLRSDMESAAVRCATIEKED